MTRPRPVLLRRTALFLSLIGCSAISVPIARVSAQAVSRAEQQLVAAVLPLPADLREGAGVMGYSAAGRFQVLRESKNGMMCLADEPSDDRFHVACYHVSLEPFMARGRALRAEGVKGDRVDTVRFAEIERGELEMPSQPAALYSLTGPAGDFDAASGTTKESRRLFVIYVPGATVQSTGLSTRPAVGTPWLMFPGTPKAHIMFTPSM